MKESRTALPTHRAAASSIAGTQHSGFSNQFIFGDSNEMEDCQRTNLTNPLGRHRPIISKLSFHDEITINALRWTISLTFTDLIKFWFDVISTCYGVAYILRLQLRNHMIVDIQAYSSQLNQLNQRRQIKTYAPTFLHFDQERGIGNES